MRTLPQCKALYSPLSKSPHADKGLLQCTEVEGHTGSHVYDVPGEWVVIWTNWEETH